MKRYGDVLVGCSPVAFWAGGCEWRNRGGRVCASISYNIRKIVAWGINGVQESFPYPLGDREINHIRQIISE